VLQQRLKPFDEWEGEVIKRQCEDYIDSIMQDILYGNAEDILPNIEENAEFHICIGNQLYTDSFAATFMGHSGVVNCINLTRQFLDILNFSATDYHHENNKMIVRGDLTCQMTATGSLWRSSWMQIWTLEEDRIRKLRMFADFHAASLPEPISGKKGLENSTHH